MGLFTPKWMTNFSYTEKLTDTRKLLRALDSASSDVYKTALKALYRLDPALLKQTVLEGKRGQYVDRKGTQQKRDIVYDYRGCLSAAELKKAILTDDPVAADFPLYWDEEERLKSLSARDLIEIASSGRLVDECLERLILNREADAAYSLLLPRFASGIRMSPFYMRELADDLTPEQLTVLFSATDDPRIRDIIACSLIEKGCSPEAEAYVVTAFHDELKEYLTGCKDENHFGVVDSRFRNIAALTKLADRITLSDEEERFLIRYSWKSVIAELLEKCGSAAARAAAEITKTFCSRSTDPSLLAQLDGDTALDLILQLRDHSDNRLGDPGSVMEKAGELIRYLYRHLADEKLRARIERELPQEQTYSIDYTYQDSEGDLRDKTDSGTVVYWP